MLPKGMCQRRDVFFSLFLDQVLKFLHISNELQRT